MDRVRYFSIIRVISCLAVVVLHTFYAGMSLFEEGSRSYVIAMTIRNCMMWAVPCFVMVSGALLLDPDRKMSYKKILGVYVRRMLIVLALFTFIYELVDCALGLRDFNIGIIGDGFYKMATDGSWKNMWYIYLMIALYLMLPFFRKVTAVAATKDIRYILGLFFLFMSVLPLVETIADIESGFYITERTIYPLYFFIGYAIHKGMIRIPKIASAISVVCGLVLIMGLTAMPSNSFSGEEMIKSLTASYSSPIILLMAAGIFSLMKGSEETCIEQVIQDTKNCLKDGICKGVGRIIDVVDSATLEIYLIHMIVLKVMMVCYIDKGGILVGVERVLLIAFVVVLVSLATAIYPKRIIKVMFGLFMKK